LTSRYRLACNSFGGIGWACSSAVDHFVGNSPGVWAPSTAKFHSGWLISFSSWLFFLFFLRSQKTASPTATSSKPPSVAPMPTPAFAPVVRPTCLMLVCGCCCFSGRRSVLTHRDRAATRLEIRFFEPHDERLCLERAQLEKDGLRSRRDVASIPRRPRWRLGGSRLVAVRHARPR
jgi:hypothetical protein